MIAGKSLRTQIGPISSHSPGASSDSLVSWCHMTVNERETQSTVKVSTVKAKPQGASQEVRDGLRPTLLVILGEDQGRRIRLEGSVEIGGGSGPLPSQGGGQELCEAVEHGGLPALR